MRLAKPMGYYVKAIEPGHALGLLSQGMPWLYNCGLRFISIRVCRVLRSMLSSGECGLILEARVIRISELKTVNLAQRLMRGRMFI